MSDTYANIAIEALKKGAFLTSSANGRTNTMTISWGSIGHIWNRDVFMVMVRPSRFSFELIEQHPEFTVSFSLDDKLKKALTICGTKSGRDLDKFAASSISLQNSKMLSVPIIAECGLHYECKIIQKQVLVPEFLDETYDGKWYPQKDYHTMYYSEIVASYLT